MPILPLILVALSAISANATPRTLVIDMSPRRDGRIARALPECQWIAPDLSLSLAPEWGNIGAGTVLRIGKNIQIKFMDEAGAVKWTRWPFLPAYRDNEILGRFQELSSPKGKKNGFFETSRNIREILGAATGFQLEPGALIVSISDPGGPASPRALFGAPIVEFIALEPETIEGVVVYKPTGRRGSIPAESAFRSSFVAYPSPYSTWTAIRAQRREAKKAARAPADRATKCEGFFN